MFKEALVQFTVWPVVSLLIFFFLLCGVLVWIFRPKSKPFYDKLAFSALEINPPAPNQTERG